MKRAVAITTLIINLLTGHALAAYDPEYGDAYSTLPVMRVLNPLEGSLMITSEFSLIGRVHPVFGSVRPHKGTDLGANMGDNVYASLDGRVIYSGWAEGYGNVVYILSRVDGYNVETRYAHCSTLLVSGNTQVMAGTIIAKVGQHRKNIARGDRKSWRTMSRLVENLPSVGKWLLIVLIMIYVAVSATLYVADSESGGEFFSMIMYKLLLYVVLIYFLLNWRDGVANLAKEMFTGFGGLMMGASGTEAMAAISDPMDIVSKGVHIIEPIYNEMFKIHGVMDLMTKIALWLPSLFFAVILTICFFAMAMQITLAYLEFYVTMVSSFATFFMSGLKQTRKCAANGRNGIFD